MVSGNIFHFRKNSWPPEEYINRTKFEVDDLWIQLDFDSGAPPEQAWRRKLNTHASILKEFSITFMEAIKMITLGIRLWSYVREEASHGRRAPIDPFNREGKPLASQGIFISREGGHKKYASVLSPGQHEGIGKCTDQGLSSWGWNLSGQHSTYHALFPRAWTVYDGEPDPDLKVSCRQISPFLPHNYRDSSLPTAVFVYTVNNPNNCDPTFPFYRYCKLITQSLHSFPLVGEYREGKGTSQPSLNNSIGGISHLSGDHLCNFAYTLKFSVSYNDRGEDGVSGVLLHHKTAKQNHPVTFAIAACETQNVNVTVLPSFGLSEGNSVTAKEMWGKMAQANFNSGPTVPSSSGDANCAAVSASTWVEPNGRCTVAFAVAWSSPKVKFMKGKSYHRRYTRYYGTSERAAENLVHDALTKVGRRDREVAKSDLEKRQATRMLYFLVAGGTVWIDTPLPTADFVHGQQRHPKAILNTNGGHNGIGDNGFAHDDESSVTTSSEDEPEAPEREDRKRSLELYSGSYNDNEDVGSFLYLEGVEYVMWCTYDVHFYASFALLELFPKIELSIQREFARAVLFEDTRKVKFLADGKWGIRKVKGAIPHDLGTHDPWHEMNAYNIHDTSKWKDLNPKFVIQVYRDFAATGDLSFGTEVWPAVCAAMAYMDQFDRDNDCLIENDGFPDQTYDAWTVHGVSAYCGCLWLAALQATAAMAAQLGDGATAEAYKTKFIKAKASFEAKLWNGSYFNYDSGSSNNSKSIQADQLAGQWYMAAAGLPNLFDDAKIRSSLQKIYDFNVMKVGGGRMGAVNGMHPNGKVDETCMQSREVWAGVTYGLAATMIHAGMEEQALTTAEGIFTAGWSEDGFGPLAIWGMQWALSPAKVVLNAPLINMMDRVPESPSISSSETSVKKMVHKAKCLSGSVFNCSC
ncbi:Beta-glucosidase, GBA2 type [Cynara cardunculus var. scolymus]|uniref:Beta-glucosidase, GBA2 type n=1 Tax=Cynara cardunculus var. scolymus TaxID=59895 RepID=A0A103XHV1_CYNCS|nr:Beta-glucosidase, GBA2 type [Cynara cardunculus var. scolymus]